MHEPPTEMGIVAPPPPGERFIRISTSCMYNNKKVLREFIESLPDDASLTNVVMDDPIEGKGKTFHLFFSSNVWKGVREIKHTVETKHLFT